ncbi:MAG: hypothetical protein NZ108_09520, partial [Bacteroidia bacterium]|nr:hypothetical protein [Bacteroidia bacterium]
IRIVNAAGTASFTTSDDTICQNSSVIATYTGTLQPGTSLSWNFAGGIPSGSGNGPYNIFYADTGRKEIILTASTFGCILRDTQVVQVNIIPTSNFSVSHYYLCHINDSMTVTYTGNANPANSQFIWNFDGATILSGSGAGPYVIKWDNNVFPGHKYITLTVIQGSCTSAVATQLIDVRTLVTTAMSYPQTICEGDTVRVDWLGTPVNGLTLNFNSYGYPIVNSAPYGPWYVLYPDSGNFTFSLVSNLFGCGTYGDGHVTVKPKPTSDFVSSTDFRCLSTLDTIPIIFTYTGQSSSNAILNWNFDNPSTTSGSPNTQSVQWNTPGPKYITLVVDDNGCVSDTTAKYIMIGDAPNVQLQTDSIVCQFDTTTVVYTGDSNQVTVQWQFAGGTVISGSGFGPYQVVWHDPNGGFIQVTATRGGCTRGYRQTIYIGTTPIVDAGENVRVCAGIPVLSTATVTNLSPSFPATYSWIPTNG